MARLRSSDAEKRIENEFGPDFSEALARGLTIVTAFDAERRQMSLSDIARVVDLPRATARRALHTLTMLGYVETDGRLFRLTSRILKLAAAYLTSNPITTIVQPACEHVCREVKESCTAAVLDGQDVVMIARALPVGLISVGYGVGYRVPAFCSALGRVLLAALPDPELDAFLDELEPASVTEHTVIDPRELRKAILQVRQNGFSFVDREAEAGFRSIAVPLKRFDGMTVAALNVGAHVDRASVEAMLGTYLPLLRTVAEDLKPQLI
jgi:IclR family transcriptional regulator, pca regulon regulatory protein